MSSINAKTVHGLFNISQVPVLSVKLKHLLYLVQRVIVVLINNLILLELIIKLNSDFFNLSLILLNILEYLLDILVLFSKFSF